MFCSEFEHSVSLDNAYQPRKKGVLTRLAKVTRFERLGQT